MAFCFFNVTNSANGGDVGACMQDATDCLRGCLANCRASKTTLNAQCAQNCVNVFSFFRDVCIGNSLNTTTIDP